MRPVLSVVPFHRCSEESSVLIDAVVASDISVVRVENHTVCSWNLNSNTVVAEAVGGVEVEDEDQASSLEHDNLVTLMLQ